MPIAAPIPRSHRKRTGLKPGPVRSAKHLDWIRQQQCCICKTYGTDGNPIQAAHIRSSHNGHLGGKPSDMYVVPLHWVCHDRQHQRGERTYFKERGIDDPAALALWYARRSPDSRIRKAADGS